MDQHNDQQDEKCGGRGMMHGMCCHGGKRVLGAIIVTLFVFWCGFQFGEMRASFGERGYEYGMMRENLNGYGPGMMRGYSNYDYSNPYVVPPTQTETRSAAQTSPTTKAPAAK